MERREGGYRKRDREVDGYTKVRKCDPPVIHQSTRSEN
jgi:hypothetical protein